MTEETTDRYLGGREMFELELNSERELSRKLKERELQYQERILMLELEARQERLKTLAFRKADLKRRNDEERSRHKSYVSELKEKYEITTEGFGYDPISGKLSTE